MWNIRNSEEDHRGRDGNLKGEKSEREMNHERRWTMGTKLRNTEGRGMGGWVSPVMGIKESVCCDEQ